MMRYSFDFDKLQSNKSNYQSLKGISQQTYKKRYNNISIQIPPQSKLYNEGNSTQAFNSMSSKHLKTENFKIQINQNQTQQTQLQQSPYNLNEDSLLDQEEIQGVQPHTLKTKRNSFIFDKENLNFMKQFQDTIDWKEKCQELQQLISQKNQQQFIQEKQITQLQAQLVNERNKCKFYEKNQDLINNIQLQLEESNNQRKLIEVQLLQLIQQNDELKRESIDIKPNKDTQNSNQLFKGSQTTRNATSYSNSQQKLKSPENKYFLSRRTSKDRQSLSNLVKKKSIDETQNTFQSNNDLQMYMTSNKSLEQKISELERQVNYLLDQQFIHQQTVESLKSENSDLSMKLLEYTNILNSIGFFQFDNSTQKTKHNQINGDQNIKANIPNQNNPKKTLTYNKSLSVIPSMKNDDMESFTDQSYTHKLSNLSQQLQHYDNNYQQSQINIQSEFRDINPLAESFNQIQDNRCQHHYEKNINYNQYIDEVKYVKDSNDNTNSLSKLCSC